MDPELIQVLPGILAITFIFGGGVTVWIVSTIAGNWRQVRVSEQHAVLKKAMIDRGFTAEEIVQVISAGGPDAAKMADNPPALSRTA